MRRSLLGLLVLVTVGSFFVWQSVFSANSDIVINEIGAYPTSTHEWVEIWNKGTQPVDLAGWTFWENNTHHAVTPVANTDSIVMPGEFAAIAQKGSQFLIDHPLFSGSVFGSTWSSLSIEGEEIGLNDAEGQIVERFTFVSASHFSLERKDPFLADYTSSNWQEHVSGNTLGAVNSNFFQPVGGWQPETISTTTTSTAYTALDVQNSTTTTTSTALNLWQFIKINEFVPNPESGSEWVELYNTSSSTVNLEGGVLCDNRIATCTLAALTETVSPYGFVVIYFANGKLNNDGDSVVLKDAAGGIVDMVQYGGGGIPVPGKGQAGARKIDGVDTDSGNDWVVTTELTPGGANSIVAPPIAGPSAVVGLGGSRGGSNSQTNISFFDTHTSWVAPGSSVVLNEIFPNPSGSDEGGEFIELKNTSNTQVSIQGWQIGIRDRLFTMTGIIDPFGLRILPRSLTGIVLPNTTSTEVRLYTGEDHIADSEVYSNAPSGQSYSRGKDGVWKWTEPTPNSENAFVIADPVGPLWKTVVPMRGRPGQALNFDAQKSVDPRGGVLSMLWSFGDGSALEGSEVEHSFLVPGTYTITLSATSTMATHGEKKFVVRISEPVARPLSDVSISEVFADPEGDDSDEFIEIFNGTTTSTDLSGCRLQTSEENSFVIPSETRLDPGKFLVFYRLATHLNLANDGGEVDLLTASGTLLDAAIFPKSSSGHSRQRTNTGWLDVSMPTPGRFAVASEVFVPDPPKKVLGTKIKNKVAKKVVVAPVAITFDNTEGLVSGRPVIARGTVTAVPGVLGKQYFYLSSAEGGMQIYQSKKDFPPLEVGDVVEVRGKISIVGGVKRIAVANKFAIDILDTAKGLAPQKLQLDDMSEENAGELVVVAGEITEITGNRVYVDDGRGEIAVYLHASAKIDKKDFKVKQMVKVIGILEQTEKGWRISPRSQADISVTGVADEAPQAVAGEKIATTVGSYNYWVVGGFGVGAVVFILLVRLRSKKSS